MLQCENEYGYYGDDKEYLKYLYQSYREKGIDVPLFTSDGTSKDNLLDGYIEGCMATLNFGSRVEENFRAHDELSLTSRKCVWKCGTAGLMPGATSSIIPPLPRIMQRQ